MKGLQPLGKTIVTWLKQVYPTSHCERCHQRFLLQTLLKDESKWSSVLLGKQDDLPNQVGIDHSSKKFHLWTAGWRKQQHSPQDTSHVLYLLGARGKLYKFSNFLDFLESCIAYTDSFASSCGSVIDITRYRKDIISLQNSRDHCTAKFHNKWMTLPPNKAYWAVCLRRISLSFARSFRLDSILHRSSQI